MEDLLSKYTRQAGGDDEAADSPLRDMAEDFVAFGWVRGLKARASMLELRKRTGHILAVGYGWIDKVEFEPSEGITLHLSGQRVHIRGRHLNADVRPGVRLFEGITRGRVSWVREMDRATLMEQGEQSVLVEDIVW